ncbi:MAG TPA: TRAP transporter substrate-binding protein [Ramlibacter sp.]|nr:TRAP transporter substrate-binding protein [Ramlibacter sp.]
MKARIVLIAAAASLPALAGAQVVLNASAWVPATHSLSMAQKEWCDQLEKDTKGGVKCNILPKAVAAPLGTFDAVRDGLADISFSVDGYSPGRFVFTQMAEFPFAGPSAEATSVAYQKMYAKYFAPLGEHRGVKVLGVFSNPGQIFNTRKAVTNNAELSSLKMRIPGGTTADMAKALGWNVTLKPATEAYELMSSGVLDGTFITVEAIKSLNLSMVKHATIVPGGAYNTTQAFIMNPAKYNALSAEHKAAVDKLSGEYASRLFASGYDRADKIGFEQLKTNHVPVVNASDAFVADMKDKLRPVEAKWADAAEAKGLKNAKAVLEEFRAEAAKAK